MFRLISITPAALLLLVPGCYSSFDEGSTASPQKIKQDESKQRARPSPPPEKKKQKKKKKKPEQTYQQAWRIICHAEKLSGVDPAEDPQQRGGQVARWIIEHVKNKKARYWFISLGQVDKSKRAQTFRREAKRAGYDTCPSEHLLFSEPRKATSDGGGP